MIQDLYDTKGGNTVLNLATVVLQWSAIATGIALVYLILAVLTGDVGKAASDAAGAKKYQIIGSILAYAVVFLSLAYTIRYLTENSQIWVLALAGAFVYFGIPVGLELGVAAASPSAAGLPNPALDILRRHCFFMGVFVWGLGAIRSSIFVIDTILTRSSEKDLPTSNRDIISKAADRPLTPNVHLRPGPLARCWELPHCIDFIREVCEPWKVKRACWRLQSGCMCDVRYLYEALKKDQTKGIRADDSDDWLQEDARQMGGGDFERKLFCRDCRIYIEHQRRKFRFLSPLALPITVLLIYGIHPFFRSLYGTVVMGTARALEMFWLTDNSAAASSKFVRDMSNEAVMWAVLVLLGIFLLSGVMRFIEWLTLEAML